MTLIINTDWHSLEHAAGSASDVPQMLHNLLSPNRSVRDEAYRDINVLTDGGFRAAYSATVPALNILLQYLEQPDTPAKSQLIVLIATIFACRPQVDSHAHPSLHPKVIEAYQQVLAQRGKNIESAQQEEQTILLEIRRISPRYRFTLLPYLCDPDPTCRACVAKALKYIGATDEEIVTGLKTARAAESEDFPRQELDEAIRKLTQKEA